MLYMIIVKASQRSEQGIIPSSDLMLEMDNYNELLEEARIKVLAKGLYPTKDALRITFKDGEKRLTKGPFFPENEQIAGFFLIDVQHEEEAIQWFQKVPDPIGGDQGVIELRKLY